MEPPARGTATGSGASGRGILSSARAPTPPAAMAHAAVSARPPSAHVYASPHDPKPSHREPADDAAVPASAPQSDDVVRQLVAQLGDAMAASLRAVAAQYGVADAHVGHAGSDAGDAHAVVLELQRARRRAAELQLLVDDLQTEQRVARERLALYSILALKLKRELVNEKLAHIDSKKEVDEIRQQYETGGAGSSVGARSPEAGASRRPHVSDQRRGSYESLRGAHSAEEDDPWSSPNKPSDAGAFGSFYSSRQPSARAAAQADRASQRETDTAGDDVEDEDEDERMMGMQPLRNSLIGQFLPSTLLDSPQLTPKARSVASGPRSLDNQGLGGGSQADDDDEASETKFGSDEDQVATATKPQGHLEAELASLALEDSQTKDASCDACGRARAPVAELEDCGHRLCRVCDHAMSSVDDPTEQRPPQCPRCFKSVRAVRRLNAADNQVDHLRIETSRPSTSDSTATALSYSMSTAATTAAATTTTGTSIAPLTLSLLSEMFENIPLDELEQFLKEASGQVSGAIERILQRHPAFNPALAAEVSVTAGPGAGSAGQKGGHTPGALHRSGSSGIPSHQQQSQQQQGGSGGGSGSASGNWKTEMCMYYLQGKCNKTRRTCSFAHGESDLVRTTTPKHTSSTSYKSRMCPLWLEGSCPKSRRECPLAHGENDLRDGLALLGQNAGGAAGGAAGAGTIQAPTLPTTAPRLQNYKTELCYYYLKGCCNFTKEECRFAHGESDLRTVESNTLEWSAQLGVAGAVGALQSEKNAMQHQYQHQYQQQQQQQAYVSQYQSQPQQQPPQPQQPALPQHPQYGLTPLPAPFVPQAHQYHQMAPPVMHPHQHQAPVPPSLQQGPYAQHQPPYRYMKSMDDAKPPRRPAPPRRESTWSQPSYDSLGPDF